MKAYYVPKTHRRRKPKRRIFILALSLLCVVALTFVYGRSLFRSSMPESSKEIQPSGRGPAPEPVIARPRMGVILPLSGAFQRESEMLRDGIGLAWKEIQAEVAQGELVVQDAGKDASEAVRIAREFASTPDTILVVAHLPAAVLSEIIPVFEEAKVPLLVVANSHESLINHRWVIPFVSSDHTEGVCAAGLAAQWARDGGAAVIHDPGPYGMILSAGFKEGAENERFAVKTFACKADDPSMEALVERALQGDPPVIWLAGSPVWGAGIIDVIMAKDFKGRLLVPQSYGRMAPDDLFGRYADRLNILWQVAVTDSGKSGMQDFRNSFLQSFLREPDWMAVLGYDAMRCAGKVLQGGELTRKRVWEHFLNYNSREKAFHGVGGEFYFDAKGYIQRPFQLVVHRHGKLMSVNR